MKTRSLTCITCPAGCRLKVSYQGKKAVEVVGNKCKKGLKFAAEEIANPVRILTTTIAIESEKICRLPVRSKLPVHRDKISVLVKEAKKIKTRAPVRQGDYVVRDLLGTGTDLISSCTVDS